MNDFRNRPSEDPLALRAGARAGIDSISVGIADLLKSSAASWPEPEDELASRAMSNRDASAMPVHP